MKDDLEQLLRLLHLRKVAELWDESVKKAEKEGLSYNAFLTRLLRAEWHHRQESRLAWRIKRARMPEQWTLESFPYKRQPGISRKQIQGFAELEFVGRAENIVFIGPTGVGKTGLALGLLLKVSPPASEGPNSSGSNGARVHRVGPESRDRAPTEV